MAPASLLLAFALFPSQDSVYADRATAELVALGRRRHLAQDTAVRDYRAVIRTRLDFAVGRHRFGRVLPILANEQVARLEWSRPNDLRLEFLGRRQRTVAPAIQADLRFDQPWFFPRAVGDSIRLLSDEIPERAALHPLAPGAERFYRYATGDSITLALPGRTIRVVALEVQPRRLAPALIAGTLLLERETGDVVRMTFFFIGEYLWDVEELDSAATRRDTLRVRRANRMAARALRIEADLEYALFEQRYWMPYRQLLTLQVEDIWITGAVLPIRFLTVFSDYLINRGEPVRFSLELPDSVNEREIRDTTIRHGAFTAAGRWRAGGSGGGRWEVVTPPGDSLDRYGGWTDSLALGATPDDERRFREVQAELAQLAEALPPDWTGGGGASLVRLGETFRFNRVQGASLGAVYGWRPDVPFLSVLAHARYGFADQRVLGGFTLRREAPSGLWELALARHLADVDPRSNGAGLGNSVSALFAGHDDADYVLASVARLSYTRASGGVGGGGPGGGGGPPVEWTFRAGFETHRSVTARAGSGINDFFFGDGRFQPNPPAREGSYAVAGLMGDRAGLRARWRLGADGLADEALAGARVWADMRHRVGPVTLALAGGAVSRGDVPQLLLRAGGPRTVRGYDFGARVGRAMWAAQLEVGLRRRGSGVLLPIVFADAGNAAAPDAIFRTTPLLGVGAGLSANLLVAELRLEFSKSVGFYNDGGARLDLLFRPPW